MRSFDSAYATLKMTNLINFMKVYRLYDFIDLDPVSR